MNSPSLKQTAHFLSRHLELLKYISSTHPFSYSLHDGISAACSHWNTMTAWTCIFLEKRPTCHFSDPRWLSWVITQSRKVIETYTLELKVLSLDDKVWELVVSNVRTPSLNSFEWHTLQTCHVGWHFLWTKNGFWKMSYGSPTYYQWSNLFA